MSGFSEVIQVVGAMIIFSIIMLSTNRYMLSNTQQQIVSDTEVLAVTYAQDIIDEARLSAFDSTTEDGYIPITIPDDFTSGPFSNTTAITLSTITSFEGYNGWQEQTTTELGTFTIDVDVTYVQNDRTTVSNAPTRYKKMIVTVTNPYLSGPVVKEYVRTYNYD